MKKDAYYFPHDSNAKDDPKCVMLIEQLGLEGYGIYWVLVEMLRDQPEYRYPMSLVPSIARRYNTQTPKVETVIKAYNLFKIENDEFFFSESLVERMAPLERKRELASIAGKKSAEKRALNAPAVLNACSTDVQPTFNACSTDVQPLEEIREEESREENIKHSTAEIEDFFESCWSMLPNKKGKGRVSPKAKRLAYQMGDRFKDCIMAFNKDMKGRDVQFIQHGSTFFNSGYVDYIGKDKPKQKSVLVWEDVQ